MQDRADSHGTRETGQDAGLQPAASGQRSNKRYAWFALLLPCYAAYLVPGSFARQTPEIAGIPFFYWWQFCWIIVTALVTGVVYRMVVERSGKH